MCNHRCYWNLEQFINKPVNRICEIPNKLLFAELKNNNIILLYENIHFNSVTVFIINTLLDGINVQMAYLLLLSERWEKDPKGQTIITSLSLLNLYTSEKMFILLSWLSCFLFKLIHRSSILIKFEEIVEQIHFFFKPMSSS